MIRVLRNMWRALVSLVFKSRADRELDKEVANHLACETERLVDAGVAPDEARRRAHVAFGSIQAMKEAHRDGRGARWLDTLFMDARYGLRQMKRAPMFTFIAVIVLALGMGVNSALIAFVDTALNPSAPGIERPDRIVRISYWGRTVGEVRDGRFLAPVTFPGLAEFHTQQTVLTRSAQYVTKQLLVSANDASTAEAGMFVTRDYFDVLRPRMALGTRLAVDERQADAAPVAVISHRFWVTKLGSDSAVIGRTIRVNGHPIAIAGVMPQGMRSGTTVWMNYGARLAVFGTDSAYRRASGGASGLIARLRDDVSRADAEKSLTTLFRSFGATSEITPLYSEGTRKQIFGVAAVFGVITAMILAIACANVSVLLLGKAVGRRREIAMRLSLGAGRGRILRQLLTESALLAMFAGVAGLLVLRWTAGVIFNTFTEAGPQLSPRWPTIAMTLIIAAGTGVVFGLLPALHATRANLADAIKDAVAGIDRRRSRLQRAFVVAEVALSMSLVSATGLLVHAVQTQVRPDAEGYDVSNDVYITDFSFRIANYTAARADELLRILQSRLTKFSDVQVVTFATGTPFHGWGAGAGRLVGDSATRESWQARRVYTIGPGYFDALGIDIERGRGVTDADVDGSLPVAMVSSALANRLWPGENALGRVLTFEGGNARSPSPFAAHSWTVVGVVRDASEDAPDEDLREIIYLSRKQFPFADNAQLIVRARSGSPDLRNRLTTELRALAPDVPRSDIRTTRQLYSESNAEVLQVGLGASLAGAFALSLACVGVYAVIAFGIAQREREIGIRIALGAARSQVVGLFFRDGMRLVLIGFVIGVPLAIAGMTLLGTQMYGLTMVTPRPVLTVIAVLLGVAALASWLPARRATRVDPIDSLRSE